MYALMHELLHFYLGNSPPPARNSATEVNEIDAAVRLSRIDALINAQNSCLLCCQYVRSLRLDWRPDFRCGIPMD